MAQHPAADPQARGNACPGDSGIVVGHFRPWITGGSFYASPDARAQEACAPLAVALLEAVDVDRQLVACDGDAIAGLLPALMAAHRDIREAAREVLWRGLDQRAPPITRV